MSLRNLDLRSQVYGQELGKKNWNGQILEDVRVLAKGWKVPGRSVFCSASLWNEYNHWDITEKLETRKQITELTMGYDIFVLDKS